MTYKKIALVIGAGGVQCAAALGVLPVLQQTDLAPDLIVGCSGGAVMAAAAALDMAPDDAAALAHRLWSREVTRRRSWRAVGQALLPRRFGFDGRFGLRDDTVLNQRLHETFGDRTFAETNRPLFITATDFLTGEQVVLRRGRLTDALRASMALPFVFAPWAVNGRLLLDGYLADPLPINVAIREGADLIIAVGFESANQPAINSPLRYAYQLSSVMSNSQFQARLAFYNLVHHAELLLLVPQLPPRLHRSGTDQLPALMAAGAAAIRGQMAFLQPEVSYQ